MSPISPATRRGRRGIAIGAATLAATLSLVMAGCSSGSTSPASSGSPSKKSSPTHLTVAVVPIVQAAPLFIAIKDGYFARQGLSVTTKVTQQSTAAVADMIHGSVAIVAAANYVSFFQGQASGGFSIKVIAANSQCDNDSNVVLALANSGITKPSDLAGKSIAVNINPNIQTLTIDAVLKQDGVSPSSVHFVTIPFPDMAAALKAHRVNAIAEVEPFITSSEEAGAVKVLNACTGPTASIPLGGYFSTASWAQQNPSTALAFQRAVQQAEQYAAQNRSAVTSVLPSFMKITPALAAKVDPSVFPSSIDAANLQNLANLMQSAGMIKQPLNVTPLLLKP